MSVPIELNITRNHPTQSDEEAEKAPNTSERDRQAYKNYDLGTRMVPGGASDTQDEMEGETIEKLKIRNTQLREELKTLNDQLTLLVSKHKVKKVENPRHSGSVDDGNAEKRLQMEFENARKHLIIYQKELRYLRDKYENSENPDRQRELDKKTFEIEQTIQKETAGNKALMKFIRDKARQIEQLQNEGTTNAKDQVIADALRATKEKCKQLVAKEEWLNYQAQSRDDYVNKLETELQKLQDNYDRASDKTGYAEMKAKQRLKKARSVPRVRAVSDSNSLSLKSNASSAWKFNKNVQDTLRFNVDNFDKLKSDMKILQKADLAKDKARKRELTEIKRQVAAAEKSKNDTESLLDEKDKEIEALNNLFRELNSIALHHDVQRLIEERREENLKLRNTKGKRSNSKSPKHRSRANSSDHVKEDSDVFNDKDMVGNQKVKICGIRVWYDGKKINGVQAVYKTKEERKFEGRKHVRDPHKYKAVKFDMEGEDYLKDVSGYVNASETAVECLVFKSFFGETRKVGKTGEKSKMFRFDIGESEFPAILYGSLLDDQEGSVLARLGVLIAADDGSTKRNSQIFPEEHSTLFDKTSVQRNERTPDSSRENSKKREL